MNSPAEHNRARGEDAEFVDLEKRMSVIVAQTAAEEQECEREQNLHNQVCIHCLALVFSIIRSDENRTFFDNIPTLPVSCLDFILLSMRLMLCFLALAATSGA